MSARHHICQPSHPLHRRRFLGASFAISAMAFAGTATLSGIASAAAMTKAQREKMTPDQILALMLQPLPRGGSSSR